MLFTRNPVTGAAERVIEASWGLGEAVVAGLVVPDRFRLDARGRVLERTAGEKDVALRAGPAGTEEVAVTGAAVHTPCLDDAQLAALHLLAEACDVVYSTHDARHRVRLPRRRGVPPAATADHRWLTPESGGRSALPCSPRR